MSVKKHIPAKDVDGEDAQAAGRLNAHDGLHALIQDGVAGVARSLRVGRHLCQDVAHSIAGRCVPCAQHPQQPQHL